jgi:toxin ParE1/3/4
VSRLALVHDEARFDVIDIAYSIADDSLQAADRFVEAFDTLCELLEETPGMGVIRDFGNPALKGLRVRAVPGFPNYPVFYTFNTSSVNVLRVLHGARDLQQLFAADER